MTEQEKNPLFLIEQVLLNTIGGGEDVYHWQSFLRNGEELIRRGIYLEHGVQIFGGYNSETATNRSLVNEFLGKLGTDETLENLFGTKVLTTNIPGIGLEYSELENNNHFYSLSLKFTEPVLTEIVSRDKLPRLPLRREYSSPF